jgi:tRNA threonylcarbamoyl adenosine modification protein YeaZ
MTILAFDSSSSVASIAILEYDTDSKKERLLYHHNKAQERTNSSVFFEGLEHAIKEHGKPDLIVVGIGPGSYNGLRSSIAAAQGMASACNAYLVALPSALAFEEGAEGYWIAGNARGGHYWLARVKNHQFAEEPHLLLPEALEALVQKHPQLPLLSSTSIPQLSASIDIIIKTPDALLLARLGKNKKSVWPLEPLYLKPVHVTAQQSLSSS